MRENQREESYAKFFFSPFSEKDSQPSFGFSFLSTLQKYLLTYLNDKFNKIKNSNSFTSYMFDDNNNNKHV